MQKTSGRLSPAVRLYAANFTVRVITMCQRDTSDHDGQPEKTRRCARGLVGRRHLVRQRTAKPWMAGRGSALLLLVVQAEQPRRDATVQFDSFGASSGAQPYAPAVKLQRLRAQRYNPLSGLTGAEAKWRSR